MHFDCRRFFGNRPCMQRGQILKKIRTLHFPDSDLGTLVRPQKWGDSQVGFRGSNASGRRIVLLPGAFWAHGASKMSILGASFLLCILQCFRVWEGMLPPGACRMSHASATVLPNPTCTRSHIWGLPILLVGERKMRPNVFLHKLFEYAQGSGTSRQNSRDIPDSSLRKPRKTNFRGRARTFRPPPLQVEDPLPTRRSPDQKVNLCALFSCLSVTGRNPKSLGCNDKFGDQNPSGPVLFLIFSSLFFSLS